jgi:hypothetical protein
MAEALVAQFRSRGLRLRVVGGMLQVAPRVMLTDTDRAAIREHLVELKALLEAEDDPAVREVLDLFPGARVLSTSQPGVWPPPGAWIPNSASRIDPYGAEMPTAPCPSCGALDWHKAGSGWACCVCHPVPDSGRATGRQDDEERG